MNEITDFIKRRFTKDCNWTTGNCYYFAIILKERFPDLQIVYLPIIGHFMAMDVANNKLYDFNGSHKAEKIKKEDKIVFLEDIKTEDPSYYKRLVRDCMK